MGEVDKEDGDKEEGESGAVELEAGERGKNQGTGKKEGRKKENQKQGMKNQRTGRRRRIRGQGNGGVSGRGLVGFQRDGCGWFWEGYGGWLVGRLGLRFQRNYGSSRLSGHW